MATEAYFFHSDQMRCTYCAMRAYKLAKEIGYPIVPEQAEMYSNLCYMSGMWGWHSVAEICRGRTLAAVAAAENNVSTAYAYTRLAVHDGRLARWDTVFEFSLKSLEIYQGIGATHYIMINWTQLAWSYGSLSQFDDAPKSYEAVFHTAARASADFFCLMSTSLLAIALLKVGDTAKAEHYICLIDHSQDAPTGEANCTAWAARAFYLTRRGQWDEALEVAQNAVRLMSETLPFWLSRMLVLEAAMAALDGLFWHYSKTSQHAETELVLHTLQLFLGQTKLFVKSVPIAAIMSSLFHCRYELMQDNQLRAQTEARAGLDLLRKRKWSLPYLEAMLCLEMEQLTGDPSFAAQAQRACSSGALPCSLFHQTVM
eukprot:TRINITY_DN1486_c0_g1_i2.p1 TRINITY_DN1486_c0_g1~~TRINITY_DN1486_c0_g1_i2.p1  ORF type:complete len:418 (-),score=41.53 TRINITY_DN1486_c0_g1_i2:69-1181(-)